MATGLIFVGAVLMAAFSVRLREKVPALVDAPLASATAGATVSARRRLWLMFGIAAVAAFAFILYGFADAASLGLLLAIAPGAATTIALLGFITYPSPRYAARHARSASLDRRAPRRYLSRRVIAGPIAAAVGLVLFLVYAGVSASPDESGLSRTIAHEDELGVQVAGPFPGWYYGFPLIVLTVLLAALTVTAVWRIAAAPAEPDARSQAFDTYWRQRTSQLVVLLSTVTLLTYTAGVLFFAGSATRRVATAVDQLGNPVLSMGSIALGWIETFSALLLLAAAGWLLLSMIERLWSFVRPPKSVA